MASGTNVGVASFSGGFEIKVEPSFLRERATEVQAIHKAMKAAFDQMNADVNSTSSYWRGDAGDANRKAYNDMKESIEVMLKRLEEHPVDLMKMAGVYTKSEADAEEVGRAQRGNVIE